MSGISLTSPPSTALEGRGGLIKLAIPFASSPAVPEPRRNARRFSESAFSTSSTREHAFLARSHSLPSIDAAVSSSSARTLGREGVVSAPDRGEGRRCCATEQGFDETADNASLGTAPCEQRGGRRVGGAVKGPPGRSVSGDRGSVAAAAAAAAEDRPPKVMSGFSDKVRTVGRGSQRCKEREKKTERAEIGYIQHATDVNNLIIKNLRLRFLGKHKNATSLY